tara:strand:- start:40 stop:720 length:681 start_codon:yes stop_codon:yes gene_type:complete
VVQEFIENFLYQNSPQPKGFYGQFPISEGFKSELGLSKKFPYEGFSTKYQGPDKTGFFDYAKKGLRSIFGNVPQTGIGGGTVGQRIIYENLINSPLFLNALKLSDPLLKLGKVISSAPVAGITTFLTPSSGAGESELEFERQVREQIRAEKIAQQQAQTQQKIINEVKQSGGGGGPAGMVGTPTGPGQTGGPAGMGFAPSNNPTGFGSNIRIGRANGGIVSLFGRF